MSEELIQNDFIELGDYLAHYGIKGQEWGKRRFQNEDGTLTAEGRIRYGYNPKFSNLTDKELQDEINKKRTQNQYIDLMTRDSKKRQQEKDALIKEIGKFGSTAVEVYDKTTLEGFRNYMNSEKMRLGQENKALNDEKKLTGTNAARKAKIDELIAVNNEQIKGWKATEDAQKDAIDKFKAVSSTTSQAVDFERKFFPDSKEVKADKQTAAENISELEPDQLKKIVDRMLLEKQYEELVNPPKKSKVEKGREVLQTIGALAGVALTVANLAKTLKKDSSAAQSDEDEEYLAHYGVKGMKKGVRRWTYEDGSLTPEGYRHYGIDPSDPNYAKKREYTKEMERRQALKDARNRAKVQSIEDRQKLRSRYDDDQRKLEYERSQIKQEQKLRAREAKNTLRNIKKQNKIDLATEKESRKIQNKAAAQNRANIRKNVVKGAASIAFMASAMYLGRYILQQRGLDRQLARDVTKIREENKAKISEIKEQSKTVILQENNRHGEKLIELNNAQINEARRLDNDRYDKETTRLKNESDARARQYEDVTARKKNKADAKAKKYEDVTARKKNEADASNKRYEDKTTRLANQREADNKWQEIENARVASEQENKQKAKAESNRAKEAWRGLRNDRETNRETYLTNKRNTALEALKSNNEVSKKELEAYENVAKGLLGDAENARSSIVGAQSATLNTGKNMAENTTNKLGDILKNTVTTDSESQVVGEASKKGRQIIANAYGGNVSIDVQENGSSGISGTSSRSSKRKSNVLRTQSENFGLGIAREISEVQQRYNDTASSIGTQTINEISSVGRNVADTILTLFSKKRR